MSGLMGFENQAALAAWVVGLLSAYGMETGKAVAVDLAKDQVINGAKRTWEWLKARFAGEPAIAGPMAALERQPDDAESRKDLEQALAGKLKYDAEFVKAFQPLMEELRGLAEAAGEQNYIQNSQRVGNVGQGANVVQIIGTGNAVNR